jgi:hypothetical protein
VSKRIAATLGIHTHNFADSLSHPNSHFALDLPIVKREALCFVGGRGTL